MCFYQYSCAVVSTELLSAEEWLLSNCHTGENSWESLGLKGDQSNQSQRKSTLNIHWKDWCWNWSSNTLASWCEEPTHWKRPWCCVQLRAWGEGDNRGRDGWMGSSTQWTFMSLSKFWEIVKDREAWCAQSMGMERITQALATEQQQFYVILCKYLGRGCWVL